ncbi:Transcription factor NIGTH1, partial [Bienertia sinuspersici]
MAILKQIRELMKVDGLTNDEVKSHLQVPPEYATAAAAAHSGAPTFYNTHPSAQVSSHYCSPTVPADFYPQPPHSQPLLNHCTIHQTQ